MSRIREGFLPSAKLQVGSTTPLRRQLYEWFRSAIVEGRLRLGQRLPSTRSLARELNVSRLTTVAAYEQLLAEGYLESFRGAGTCVAASIPELLRRRASRGGLGRPGSAAPRHLSKRVKRLQALPEEGRRIAGPFRVSLPALDCFPARAWSRIVTRQARDAGVEDMAYGDPMGQPQFRAAVAEYLGAVRGVRCDSSQVIVTAGSQHGLQIALNALLDPGDAIWVEEPGYPGAHRAFAIAGCEAVPVQVDAEGLNVEQGMRQNALARAAYVTPSHQYPLGMVLSARRRIQLLNWAKRSGAWIIEDDYDSEYRFGGQPISSLQGLDVDDRVIYMGTFSKVIFPAIRLGYLVVPEDLVPPFKAARDAIDIFPPVLYQRAVTDFIRQGLFARHIRRMRTLYAQRRERMLSALKRELGTACEIIGAQAGLHLVVRLPGDTDDKAIAARAAAAGIACIAISACCLEPPQQGGLILGFGGVDTQHMNDAVRKLARVIRAGKG